MPMPRKLPKFQFLTNFRFLTKISIFDQNLDFLPKVRFLDIDFGPRFLVLVKISIFGQNFDFRPKFRFLPKISIFGQNFNFWPMFSAIFFDFWQKKYLYLKFYFWPKIRFSAKNFATYALRFQALFKMSARQVFCSDDSADFFRCFRHSN